MLVSQTKKTVGEPVAIKLTPIVGPEGWLADGSDIALVDFEIVDKNGNPFLEVKYYDYDAQYLSEFHYLNNDWKMEIKQCLFQLSKEDKNKINIFVVLMNYIQGDNLSNLYLSNTLKVSKLDLLRLLNWGLYKVEQL